MADGQGASEVGGEAAAEISLSLRVPLLGLRVSPSFDSLTALCTARSLRLWRGYRKNRRISRGLRLDYALDGHQIPS